MTRFIKYLSTPPPSRPSLLYSPSPSPSPGFRPCAASIYTSEYAPSSSSYSSSELMVDALPAAAAWP